MKEIIVKKIEQEAANSCEKFLDAVPAEKHFSLIGMTHAIYEFGEKTEPEIINYLMHIAGIMMDITGDIPASMVDILHRATSPKKKDRMMAYIFAEKLDGLLCGWLQEAIRALSECEKFDFEVIPEEDDPEEDVASDVSEYTMACSSEAPADGALKLVGEVKFVVDGNGHIDLALRPMLDDEDGVEIDSSGDTLQCFIPYSTPENGRMVMRLYNCKTDYTVQPIFEEGAEE